MGPIALALFIGSGLLTAIGFEKYDDERRRRGDLSILVDDVCKDMSLTGAKLTELAARIEKLSHPQAKQLAATLRVEAARRASRDKEPGASVRIFVAAVRAEGGDYAAIPAVDPDLVRRLERAIGQQADALYSFRDALAAQAENHEAPPSLAAPIAIPPEQLADWYREAMEAA